MAQAHPITTFIRSDNIDVAGGMQMMANHLLDSIDPQTAHPSRVEEVVQRALNLAADAEAIAGFDHRNRDIRVKASQHEYASHMRGKNR